MRARGAEVTDIVVLVVAADDGVMPQTVEAIDHAKAADVPIIVAVNKIDRADANPDRVLQQLSEHGLVPEAWGGDTIVVEVSALQGLGIDDLLEQLRLVAEVEELEASPEGAARGAVLEANLEVGRGPVATVIVQQRHAAGRRPHRGRRGLGQGQGADRRPGRAGQRGAARRRRSRSSASPSRPQAGDEFRVATDLTHGPDHRRGARAQRIRLVGPPARRPRRRAPSSRTSSSRSSGARRPRSTSCSRPTSRAPSRPCTESLRKLERDDVKLSLRPPRGGRDHRERRAAGEGVERHDHRLQRPSRPAGPRDGRGATASAIRTYEIIYKLIEDIEAAMLGMLAPEFEEVVTGEAEVREVFRVPRVGAIAGCYVRDGVITRGSKVRFLREGVVIWKGAISSLRRFKDDVREVAVRLRVRHRAHGLPGPQGRRHHRDLRGARDPRGA